MRRLLLFLLLVISGTCCFSQSRYISQTTKKIVYSRDGGACKCCGSSLSLEYDHIMPFSCGGSSDASNIQLLCQKCNRSKSNSCYCKIHDRKMGYNCCDGKSSGARSGTVATQCTGTTKKGTRCRKTTTDPSGRCHYHR